MPTAKVVEQLAARLGVPPDAFAGLGNGAKVSGGGFLTAVVRVIEHLLSGRTEAALAVLDNLRAEARDPQARWLCEYAAAACASRLGRTQDVHQRLSDLEPMYRGLPTAARALTSTMQTGTARELGRNREALDLGQRAVSEADAVANDSGFRAEHVAALRVKARTTYAAALGAAGRISEALDFCRQAVDLAAEYALNRPDEGHDDTAPELTVVSHWMYAVALTRDGKYDEASTQLSVALRATTEEVGTELWCRVRLAVVSLFLDPGVPSESSPEVLLNEVAGVRHAAKGQLDAQIFTLRAELSLRSGDIEAALEHAQAALDSGMLGSADRIRTLMTVVKVSTDLGLEERRLSALDELLQHLDTADPEEVRPALLKEVAALSVRTLRNHHGRS